ncbi:MAG: low molecular weight protein-tyrosine-phosphatase [Verrucomicrobiota bacterium]
MVPAPFRILFVCMGNICRSPAAENVMRSLIEEEGLGQQLACDSAGTIGYHQGNPPDERMSAAGQERGYPFTGSARQVEPQDLQDFHLVLAMDHANLKDLQRMRVPKGVEPRLFCEFCREHEESAVPDPYYGGDAGFRHVLDLIEDGCRGILATWRAGGFSS